MNFNKEKNIILIFKDYFSIGTKTAIKICYTLGINPFQKGNKLSSQFFENFSKDVLDFIKKNFKTKEECFILWYENINWEISIKTFKGYKHTNKLPVRGQRSHPNAKTCKKLSKW